MYQNCRWMLRNVIITFMHSQCCLCTYYLLYSLTFLPWKSSHPLTQLCWSRAFYFQTSFDGWRLEVLYSCQALVFAYFLKVYCVGLVLELVKGSSVSMFSFSFQWFIVMSNLWDRISNLCFVESNCFIINWFVKAKLLKCRLKVYCNFLWCYPFNIMYFLIIHFRF